ncbi:6-phosphogluconate dehydrogenase [Poronia punctata]|nr:6-phosphogluconate dehydrogenase [Poronia punctata]
MATPLAKIGIISIGDMGVGIARLLVANGFSVATNCAGRSKDTIERAKSANVELYKTDEDLVSACDVLLSVVPPRDAVATASRIADAVWTVGTGSPLYFADLNALAPSTTRSIAALFEKRERTRTRVRFIDGAIIGGPPSLQEANSGKESGWNVPSIPLSGPHKLSSIPVYGARLASTLNTRHISDEIGAASGLKMCFASLTKGFISIAIQSFSTAGRLGVLDELRDEFSRFSPAHWTVAERGVTSMAPKAYRWVAEMEEIATTFDEEAGFARDMFRGVAGVYRTVAEDTVLGQEKVGSRKRGLDVADMAAAMAEGIQNERKKND